MNWSQQRDDREPTTPVRAADPHRSPPAGRPDPPHRPDPPYRPDPPDRHDPSYRHEPDPRYRPEGPSGDEPLCASWDPATRLRRRRPPAARGFRGFLRSYGWRVYALPVLIVLSALGMFYAGRLPVPGTDIELGTAGAPQSTGLPPTTAEPAPTPLVPNPDAPKFAEAKLSAELPVGGVFTESGPGTWAVVPGSGPQLGAGELFTYSVELETGIVLPGGPEGLAHIVDTTLANPKSWIGSGKYAFQRVDTGDPDIRITLASQQTARQICGFRIPFDASCWRGGRVVLNTARWERGAVAFQGNVIAYQQYVVNHEVGHALGFSHKGCGEPGGLAPIMMQQTWGVSNDYLAALGTDNVIADGKTCQPNPWPYPTPG